MKINWTKTSNLVKNRLTIQKWYFLLPVLMCIAWSANSQNSVSGIVSDEDGEVLISVNVQVKGTNNGTATDFDGKYVLENVNEDATLVFSYIGYQTQ